MIQYVDGLVDWLAARSDLQLAGMVATVLWAGKVAIVWYRRKHSFERLWGEPRGPAPTLPAVVVDPNHVHRWIRKMGKDDDEAGAVRACACGAVQRLRTTGCNHLDSAWIDNDDFVRAMAILDTFKH